MSQTEEIERLKGIGMETTNANVVHCVILNLSSYGHKSIPAIVEVIKYQPDSEVREYGMETITKIIQGVY